jgi:hypothetical protein
MQLDIPVVLLLSDLRTGLNNVLGKEGHTLAIKITPNPHIGVEKISKLEEKLGMSLPDDYRGFLLRYNGGEPERNVSQTGSPRVGVHIFYGIIKRSSGEHWRDLLWHRHLLIDRVPTNILPIAGDEGGNQICLSLRPESYGWIYYWDHELEAEEGQPATFDNMSKINSSFRAFVQSLRPDPVILQPGQKPGQGENVWIAPGFLEELEAMEKKKKATPQVDLEC